MADIFLSYASQDRDRIAPLVEALERDGFDVWWDRNIQPGPSFDREIEQAIAASRCVVVAWSTHSVESEWVRSEVEEGARRGILIPLLLDDVMPPLAHRRRQAANLSHWDGEPDDEYDKLVTAIRRTLAQDGDVPAPASAPRPARRPKARRTRGLGLITVLCFGALCLGAASTFFVLRPQIEGQTDAAPDRIARRFEIALPDGWVLAEPRYNPVTITADGSHLVINVAQGTELAYLVQPLTSLEPHFFPELAGPGSIWASFEGDRVLYNDVLSEQMGFMGVSSGTHALRFTPPDPNIAGASWSSNGVIAVGQRDLGIAAIYLADGAVEMLTTPEAEMWHIQPAFCDEGTKLLYVVVPGATGDEGQIRLLDLESRESQELLAGTQPLVTASGHLMYTSAGSVWATALDPATCRPYGEPVRLFESMPSILKWASTPYAVSSEGTLVRLIEQNDIDTTGSELGWLDMEGRFEPIAVPFRSPFHLRLGADDRTFLANMWREGGGRTVDVWIHDLLRERTARLTFQDDLSTQPMSTTSGDQIVYIRGRVGSPSAFELYSKRTDGTGEPRRLTNGAGSTDLDITPDEKTVVLESCYNLSDGCDIARVPLSGGEILPVVASPSSERHPSISHDGRWLAYVSDESGEDQVYVRPWPDVESGRWQVSFDGGTFPVWSRSDNRLFFVASDSDELMVVRYEDGAGFVTSSPEALVDLSAYEFVFPNSENRNFDIDLAGERLLITRSTSNKMRFEVVVDWFNELERLAPTRP